MAYTSSRNRYSYYATGEKIAAAVLAIWLLGITATSGYFWHGACNSPAFIGKSGNELGCVGLLSVTWPVTLPIAISVAVFAP